MGFIAIASLNYTLVCIWFQAIAEFIERLRMPKVRILVFASDIPKIYIYIYIAWSSIRKVYFSIEKEVQRQQQQQTIVVP